MSDFVRARAEYRGAATGRLRFCLTGSFTWREDTKWDRHNFKVSNMREIVHIQAGQCGNQIGAKVGILEFEFVVIQEHFFKLEP